ncbi:HAMP domain-containing sensor histidine kinase [Rickettsiaceae bacterium]|nr:HAMP domain-containing sensor histidine kinase [Rickettsiaceae bacterium]
MTKEIESSDTRTRSSNDEVSFFSKIIHEFKNPIHSINGITEYLNKNWKSMDDQTRDKCLNAILNSTQTLSSLLNFLPVTHYSHDITFNFKKVDIVSLTQNIVLLSSNMHVDKPNIDIKLESSIGECTVLVDSFWYERLLINLISNAIYYSDSGTVSVKLRQKQINGMHYFMVLVQDEGIGIPKEELDSIFDPFNRGSKKHTHPEGLGIGLSICREIADAHRGTIVASNNSDIGATFEFSMPIE